MCMCTCLACCVQQLPCAFVECMNLTVTGVQLVGGLNEGGLKDGIMNG